MFELFALCQLFSSHRVSFPLTNAEVRSQDVLQTVLSSGDKRHALFVRVEDLFFF